MNCFSGGYMLCISFVWGKSYLGENCKPVCSYTGSPGTTGMGIKILLSDLLESLDYDAFVFNICLAQIGRTKEYFSLYAVMHSDKLPCVQSLFFLCLYSVKAKYLVLSTEKCLIRSKEMKCFQISYLNSLRLNTSKF